LSYVAEEQAVKFLAQRDRQPELMDQPGLDRDTHHRALDGLRAANAISRTSQVMWRGVMEAGIVPHNGRPLRILDIATGGGDVLIGVAKLAARHGVAVETHGCDISATAVEYAQSVANQAKLSDTKFFQLNVLVDPLPEEYDVVMSTLFFHHLGNDDAKQLLGRMAKSAKRCVLVDDLCRSRLGYLYAWAGGRLLTRSPIVHADGPLSVSAAFTISEFRRLAQDVGLRDARFKRHWPQRFLMSWNKP
jgi:2-polyprenyl-3-methyl-5-hydroxy-6-metoxy-1,4-benzoquinol methylase